MKRARSLLYRDCVNHRRFLDILFLACLVAVIIEEGREIYAHLLGSLGMIGYKNALTEASIGTTDHLSLDTYTSWERLNLGKGENSPGLDELEDAVSLAPDSWILRWELGRVNLASGDAYRAARVLYPISSEIYLIPYLYQDVLSALTRAGEFAKAIDLFERFPPKLLTKGIRDNVVLAYFMTEGEGWQEKASYIRPNDLYINYLLWRDAMEARNWRAASEYQQRISFFPLEVISPFDLRLLPYDVWAIPKIYLAGIWDEKKTFNVVSYLVWQYFEIDAVESLLEQLISIEPIEPDWSFLLGETYHRRGNFDLAEYYYRKVIQIDPDYSQAYLRLSDISYRNNSLEEASEWIGKYLHVAPDDLLGLKLLSEVSNALDIPDDEQVLNQFVNRINDQRIAANLMGLSTEDIKLGDNLLKDGNFENWAESEPNSWRWVPLFGSDPFAKALFVGNSDSLLPLDGKRYVRVEGFWLDQALDKTAPRAGYWRTSNVGISEPILLSPGQPYLLSFDFKTSRLPKNKSLVWVTSEPDVFWKLGYGLPDTGGTWEHFVAVGWNRSDQEMKIRPAFEVWAPGVFELDRVQVRHIDVPAESQGLSMDTKFYIR
jgi:tetratricopeptide (TPR) repeat protein